MSIARRKTSAGKTANWHYAFMLSGRRYYGVCKNCTTVEQAKQYEAEIKSKVQELARQKSVKALVENFRQELTGGVDVSLLDCWKLYLDKPSRRNRTDRYLRMKKSRFEAFCRFSDKLYPEGIKPRQITLKTAEKWVKSLRDKKFSAATVNAYHKCLIDVFDKIGADVGLPDNPFAKIPLLQERGETREAFTRQELELILNDPNAPQYIREIFIVGICTALREGDICTLKWSEIDREQNVIRKRVKKTGALVEIPILPPLAKFLDNADHATEYVLPHLAEMYATNSSGISYRVKKYLESIGIKTTKTVQGRNREISVKDVHSLRHTFCYFAGLSGIPLVVVQSVVGHMTPEMTSHYTAHADLQDKQEKLRALQRFIGVTELSRKEKILRAIETATQEQLQAIEAILTQDKRCIE